MPKKAAKQAKQAKSHRPLHIDEDGSNCEIELKTQVDCPSGPSSSVCGRHRNRNAAIHRAIAYTGIGAPFLPTRIFHGSCPGC